MVTLDLSSPPLELTMNLTRDSDWIRVIETTDGETFPVGSQVVLDFGETTWPATVTATEARWDVDKTQVNALIAATDRRHHLECRLRYASGTTDLLWAAGRVDIDG